MDTGSGTVFGPFEPGTRIKYTEANRAPTIRAMGGPNSVVSWHIWGTGDAAVLGVDASGNAGAQVSCLVPPPPK